MIKSTKKKKSTQSTSRKVVNKNLQPNIVILGDKEITKKIKDKLKNYRILIRSRNNSTRAMESIDRKTIAVITTSPLESEYLLNFVKAFKSSPVGNLPLYTVLFRELPGRNINKLYQNGVEAVFYYQSEKNVMLELIARNLKLHIKHKTKKVLDVDLRLENFLKSKLKAHGFSNLPKFHVENSQVKLKGVFPTLRHQRRIKEFFEQAPGVQAIDTSQIKIKDFSISDQTLKKRIKSNLKNIDELDLSGIEIMSVQGVVTLMGEVPNPSVSEEALHMTEQIKGIKEIHNFLEAKKPKQEKHGKRLANKLVKQIQQSFPYVENIEIVFYDDVATVSGKVSLLSNKNYIERFILQNSHAAKIINKIQVSP